MKRVLALAGAFGALLSFTSGAGALPPAAHARDVCRGHSATVASCTALAVTDENGVPLATTGPIGLSPAQLHAAYGLPNTGPSVQKIAIVDAYDDPTAEADLGVFSSTYGLPACTSANGCFAKYNQSGQKSSYPTADPNWALEISLDVQTVHAMCQNCKIILVEAKTSALSNMLSAVDEAVKLGANEVVNSYGFLEFSTEASYDSHYSRTGVAFVASSGDSGYGMQWPAASQYVTAVGGTTLSLNADNTRASETAWAGAGSGCSLYEPKPTWQKDTSCAKRSVADVSADADPASGASVYDTTPYQTHIGWFRVGGTSLSAPLVASAYALAGNVSSTKYGSYPYSHLTSLYDVLSGSNGTCGTYLCNAGTGFDGPTGLGSIKGTGGY